MADFPASLSANSTGGDTFGGGLTIFVIGKGFPPPLPGQMPLPDYETNLFYILFLTSLVIAGGGKYALDNGIWAWAAKSAAKS